MKKTLWIMLAVVGVIAAIGIASVLWYFNVKNSLVILDEGIQTQWAQVENQLQRRYDLIPNLVNTAKGYAGHEKSVFLGIAESRSKLAGAKTIDEKVAASNKLEGALSRLLMVVENYPQLKANENFTRLMDELAGAENRLSVERMRYNEAIKVYNIRIRTFPVSVVAQGMGFAKKALFTVEEQAKATPQVNFQ